MRLAAAVANAGGLGTVSIPRHLGGKRTPGQRFCAATSRKPARLTDGVLAVNVPVGADTSTGKALPFSAAYVGAVVEAVRDRGDRPTAARDHHVGWTARHGSRADPGQRPDPHPQGRRHATGNPGRARRSGRHHRVGLRGGRPHAFKACTYVRSGSQRGGGCDNSGHSRRVVHATGRSLAAALAMGAEAIALGTRFAASHDNTDWDPAFAARILAAREAADILFSAIYGPSRALPSRGIEELAALTAAGADHETLTRFKDERLIAGQRDGDLTGGILPCGQIAGALNEIIDVAGFIPAMIEQAIGILRRMGRAC